MTPYIILIYGLLVLAGGIMGYVKANSMASLVAGGVSGLVLIGSAVAMLRGMYQVGWWLALIVAVILLARFGMAAYSSGFKMMPGGLMIILSVIAIVALLVGRTR
ncbi:MAG: TMEM14 family protein [Pyrinomonadaceae bacterium]